MYPFLLSPSCTKTIIILLLLLCILLWICCSCSCSCSCSLIPYSKPGRNTNRKKNTMMLSSMPFCRCLDYCLVLLLLLLMLGPWSSLAQGNQHNNKHKKKFSNDKNNNNNNNNNDECPLWLALSHTSTDKKPVYGLYAGRSYRPNETIAYTSSSSSSFAATAAATKSKSTTTINIFSELAIPLIDMLEPYNRDTPMHDAIIEFIENHVWTAEFVGSQWEAERSAPVAIPGIGVLANYHSGISNVDFTQASVLLRSPHYAFEDDNNNNDNILQPGVPHPSRGAITPYFNVTIHATQDIPAGMELFADFGNVWDGNYTDDAYQDKFMRFDYEQADKIIDALVEFYNDANLTNNNNNNHHNHHQNALLSLELQQDILDFMLHTVLGTVAGKHAKTIRSLIPENPKKLQQVQKAGGSFLYRYSDMIKSAEWFQQNGICLNALTVGMSTIPDAGRGAFATKSISRGETIAITPMLHIADQDLLNIYPFLDDDAKQQQQQQKRTVVDRTAKPIGKQLLINYCFGHEESSMVLFPLGNMVTFINHGPTPQDVNAMITWSKAADQNLSNQHEHHDMTVNQMAFVDRIVLVMKIVATKEIEPGQEIFINYGANWERAWQDYKIKWEMLNASPPTTPHMTATHPFKAQDVKEYYKHHPLETRETLQMSNNAYPPNMATACFLETRERPDGFPMRNIDTNHDIYEWYGPTSYHDYKGKKLYIVDVLERHEAPGFFYNYTVVARMGKQYIQQVVNVPHVACTFVDAVYSSDIHIPNAFRHYIGIPDHIFPQAWRDRR